MLSYELQFFAKDGPGGEKTEPATQKKLDDARKEGQVAKSREVNMGLSLLAAFLVAKVAVGLLGNGFLNSFSMIYGQIPEAVKLYDGNIPFTMLYTLIRGVLFEMLKMMAPFLIIGFLVAFIADIIQVKWKPTFKPMQPKLSKFNPLKGMKKIFSTKSLVELFKSICKIAMIGWVAYQTLSDQIGALLLMYDMPLLQAIAYIGNTVIGLGVKISALYMVIAFADFLYQKWKFSEDMKMTKQEV
ncbi:MAG: EscU/YscU/HrcU family type III secretion system export apparatus switch protein, partial [Lachnospiraceae bacterium]